MGYYDTRIRRELPRSRVIRRQVIQAPWESRSTNHMAEHGRMVYARRAWSRQHSVIVPLSAVFAVFFFISLVLLTMLVTQTFKTAKAQPPVAGNSAESPVKEQPAAPAAARGAAQGELVKILLLGSDQRPNDGSYRTDVMILLLIDTGNLTVSAVSFPRDLWVDVPGMYEMKINMVHQLGGFEATAQMFESNFGVRPDYYLMTNFNGFTQFVDNRGGIDVQVGQELTDSCDLPKAKNGACTVRPGKVHMDGPTALWYVRSRASTSDFDRLRRAQEVVLALGKKLAKFKTVRQFAKLQKELGDNIQTNFSPQVAVNLLPVAVRLLDAPENIHGFAISEDHAAPSTSWEGMWILLPDHEAIRALLQEAGAFP